MASIEEDLELQQINKQEDKEPSELKRLLSKEPDEKLVKKSKSSAGKHKSKRLDHPEGLQRSMSTPASPPSRPLLVQRSISSQPMTVGVFLIEKSGRLLTLNDGRNTTAGMINKVMRENLTLPQDAAEVFCVWLISPLLELQLKDHHRPFKLRKIWPELLRKFTDATEETIEKDEPILCYQRNSFYPLADEKTVTDDRVIKRLYEEAKCNILNGNYPVSNAEALKLGGIIACVEYGKFDESVHKQGFFKNKLVDFLPRQTCKQKLSFRGRSSHMNVENHLLDEFKKSSADIDQTRTGHVHFLRRCWALPYYGSAFFKGQIERPTWSLSSLWNNSDVPIRVAINRDSLHVIDSKNDVLLGLPFEELSWDYSPAEDDPDCFDCFWLEFDAVDSDGGSSAQRLQIFSKQAVMMDAMVQSCVECERPDDLFTSEGDPEAAACGGRIRCRMERLSLSAFETSLDRKKKSNLSFSNPFKKSFRHHEVPTIEEQ